MARHGEGAEGRGHVGREYWSPRLPGMYPWGRYAKWLTHRKERRQRQRDARKALKERDSDG